jgi:LysM repeat protein
LSLMLRRGIEVIVGAALAVVVLFAVVPAVAQAQEEARSAKRDASATSVVVRPGDTLWSISEEHLGPNATPQRIAAEVERIYALNRDRIGSDPNLIASGQELSLPAAGGSLSADKTADEAATKKTAPAARETAAQGAGRTANGQPSDQQVTLPNLPKMPTSAAVPAVVSPSSNTLTGSPVASFPEKIRSAVTSAVRSAVVAASVGTLAEAQATADGRRLLGWSIMALTLLVCALMAWKLPMRRNTGDEYEEWGIYPGYYGRYAYSPEVFDPLSRSVPQPASLGTGLEPSAEPSANGSKAEANATQKGASPVGPGGITQRRRQTRPLPRNKRRRSAATEAHSAEAQRALRGAVLRTRARAPRNGRLKTARRIAEGGR